MLKSSVLALSSLGLIASAYFFPNQSVGLFAGGVMGGAATVYAADKERNLNKRASQIEVKERSASDAETTHNYLKAQYQAKLAEVEGRKRNLDELEAELKTQQHEVNKLESEKLALEQEKANLVQEKQHWTVERARQENELQALQQQLDDSKLDLKDRQRFLIGLSEELETQKSQLEELRSQLAVQQERNRAKEAELAQRRDEFEQGKESYQSAIQKAEEAKVELHILKQVEKGVEERSRPLLDDLQKQRLDLEAQKEEFQIEVSQKQAEKDEFAARTAMIAQMLEEQAAADEQAKNLAMAQVEDAKAQAIEEVRSLMDDQAKRHAQELMLRDRAMNMARSLLVQSRIPDEIVSNPLSNEELLANNAITRALKIHGIIVKEPHVKPIKNKGFELHFKVLPFLVVPPERQVKGSEVPIRPLSEGEALMMIGKKVLPDLIAVVPGTSVKRAPVVDLTQYGLRITFDTTGVDLVEAQVKNPYAIEEPARTHVVDFFKINTHIGLVGPTNIGKSTQIDNYLNLMKWDLERENGKPTHIIVADTKPSRQLEAWRPQYIGEYEGLKCLKRVRDEINKRREAWMEDYRKERPYREFPDNYIFFIDEVNLLLPFNTPISDQHKDFLDSLELQPKNAVSALLLEIWRLGREFGIRLLIAGQNLKADVFNINILDLANLGWIYCGRAIEDYIRNCNVKDDRKLVETQYALRTAKYRQSQEKKDKHFALFHGDGTLYLANTLAQGEWQDVIAEAEAHSGLDEVIRGLGQNLPQTSDDRDKVSANDDQMLNLLKRRLEESLSLNGGGLEDEEVEGENLGFLEWDDMMEPTALVDEAKERIITLIVQGMDKPKDICEKVWGDKINFRARPYNGKNGVKVLIENLVKSARS